MQAIRPIRRIAVVGAGAVGASWATLLLACGFSAVATDPAARARIDLHHKIKAAQADLARIGLSFEATRGRLEFTPDLDQALWDADFILESGPEKLDDKIKLFVEMDAGAPANTIVASSSLPLIVGKVQSARRHPERCVIGHPSDLPHLTSLVEVVGGVKTSQEAIRRTKALYISIGKTPIHLRMEHAEA